MVGHERRRGGQVRGRRLKGDRVHNYGQKRVSGGAKRGEFPTQRGAAGNGGGDRSLIGGEESLGEGSGK